MSTPDRHLPLDELSDALAGEATAGTAEHLAGCAECTAAIGELRAASSRVTSDLAALPAPAIPADVARSLAAALAATSVPTGEATVTTLPPAQDRVRRPARWLPAVAAGVVLLAGAGYGLSQLSGSGGETRGSASSDSAAKAAPNSPEIARNDSGRDYTGRDSLSAVLPELLAGTATPERAAAALAAPSGAAGVNNSGTTKAAGDPLARLRGTAGLAECLAALLPPDDPSVRPLALDYGSFKGKPAMVVVLPSTLANKLDVFVVGPACSRANDSTLFYASVDKP